MLQQGKFVGDVCFYLGERPPTLVPPKYIDPALGPGYDCDYCNAEVLLERMSVKDGRIVLQDGMSYRLLVLQNCVSTLPEVAEQVGRYQRLKVSSIPSKAMSVNAIKKLQTLVIDGATVIGDPPVEDIGLKNYPECDQEVRRIASEIWGDLDGKTKTVRRYGKGRVIWGKTPREVLLADGIMSDCTFTGQADNPRALDYIHRTAGDTEIYFVANRTNQLTTCDFTFRISGKIPEIFDPVNGSIRAANSFRQEKGCTVVPLEFDRFGSYFIVFRKPVSIESKNSNGMNFPKLVNLQTLDGSWKVEFDPGWGGAAEIEFSEFESWTKSTEEGIKYYSGKATYHKTFDLIKDHAEPGSNKRSQHIFLDLGDVRNVAQVRLNGVSLGILWCAPWRVDITDIVRNTSNYLEVDVVNLWPNRVIGDLSKPKGERYTTSHDVFRFDMLTKTTPLLDSGLLGPVKILAD